MDKLILKYRESEFEKVSILYKEFNPKIKIIKPSGETNWLDISEDELISIKNILIK